MTTPRKFYDSVLDHICERLIKEGKVFGCGKPFKLNHIKNDENGVPVYLAQVCDYI